jgi:hypothetical protein
VNCVTAHDLARRLKTLKALTHASINDIRTPGQIANQQAIRQGNRISKQGQ